MINGHLVDADSANFSVGDMAIQRGYGVFDFFKFINWQPVFLDDHLDRLFHSARQMRLEEGLDREDLIAQIISLIYANQLKDVGIRITLTGGYAEDGYSIHRPNLIITLTPLTLRRDLPPGIRLISHPFQRQLPEVKTIDYLMAIWLQPFIKAQGADDVVYRNGETILECPRANLCIINANGELQTTRTNVLAGITRNKVLELAQQRVPLSQQDIQLADLYAAREAFITSTTKLITPVLSVDGQWIGTGHPGPVTKALSADLLQLVFSDNRP
jgi:branched-chain amino acid aminotransferase